MANIYLFTVGSFEKVMPDNEPLMEENENTIFKNERFHFQAVCVSDDIISNCRLTVSGALAPYARVRVVGYVPAYYTWHPSLDDYVIQTNAGIFPDVLCETDETYIRAGKRTVFWITVHSLLGLPAGRHEMKINLCDSDGNILADVLYVLTVTEDEIENSDFKYTNWIHYDCICDKHNVEPFSQDFYRVTVNYIRNAVGHGMSMLFTPLFTPPLDTKVGGERMTVQLVKIHKNGENYLFDFSELETFIDFAFSCGIRYIEFSHLATQGGAEHCPKIMANVDGVSTKIFGWEDDSLGQEYLSFLDTFLDALGQWLKGKGITEKCFFHISDEPDKKDLLRYEKLVTHVSKRIGKSRIIDAVLHIEKAEMTANLIPVVLTLNADAFPKKDSRLWYYYCCSSGSYHTNRFLVMPSPRTAILGAMLYLYNADGFLHWGHNFYYSQFSLRDVDPFSETDAGGAFPAGDAFIVYPGKDGPIDSLRHEVFYDGLQDYSLLKTLEKMKGRAFVERLLEQEGIVSFSIYPRSSQWYTAFRSKLKTFIHSENKSSFSKGDGI